ncbi:MAG: penicillin-binding protein 1C [Cyanobacteria bacterium J06641_5]
MNVATDKSVRRWAIAISILVVPLAVLRLAPLLQPLQVTALATSESAAATFRDRQGLLLGTVLDPNRDHRVAVPLEKVSPAFQQAILAAEDGRFYHHGPLELRAIARAIFIAIHEQRIRSGASTITMQLARLIEPAPRTLRAKGREVWLSWRLAAGSSKDEILEAYINRLPMGSNIYGAEAAARVYFGMPAADLDVARASLLAALPNDPVDLDPYTHFDRLKHRQRYVLNRMVADGYLDTAAADRAYREIITLQPRDRGIVAAPHFLFWLVAQSTPERSGEITTTLDRPLQEFATTQLRDALAELTPANVRHGAVLVLDNPTGEVLAYIGSPGYFAGDDLGNDGVQALRQPGSTLKPFLYQLALERGIIRPQSILADVPTDYAIPGQQIYSPTDFDETFLGPLRLRAALANSRNVPAVRLLERVGVAEFQGRLQALGFEHLQRSPDHYGLGLALGSAEVSLWELAQAYRTLAKQGRAQASAARRGVSPSLEQTFPNPETWALVTDILSDRHARARSFGLDSALDLPFDAAVKTGTSSNFRDAWTVGFSQDYTVAVWVGNFDGAPMHQISGAIGAAPLWQRLMLHLHTRNPPERFPPPPGLVESEICTTTGHAPTPDCPAIAREYLYPNDLRGNLGNDPPAATTPEFAIAFPREGDRFWVGPQPLQFALQAPTTDRTVTWVLNGQPLGPPTPVDRPITWELQPGQWTLEARRDGTDTSDLVNFTVEAAPAIGLPRGFSHRQ